jgi:hypothetical protein
VKTLNEGKERKPKEAREGVKRKGMNHKRKKEQYEKDIFRMSTALQGFAHSHIKPLWLHYTHSASPNCPLYCSRG